MSNRNLSSQRRGRPSSSGRRVFLRGAGVCLALPWLEAFQAKTVYGQQGAPLRFLPIYFPNGAAADYWSPTGSGVGGEWGLSPILEPLAELKEKMVVLSNLENYSCMQEEQSVEPSHARCSGAFLTCMDSDVLRRELNVDAANGISLDQLIAQGLPRETAFASLQLGLSTIDSYCDGRHCSLSQSISWGSQTEPLYKEVNPQAVFDRLVGSLSSGGEPDGEADAEAERRKALSKSVLDAVLENAVRTQSSLGRADKLRLEQFLDSVRELEIQVDSVAAPMAAAACEVPTRFGDEIRNGLANGQEGYDRAVHSQAMTDLIVMALRCDATRVISYMLDDARSDFVYDHLENREFTNSGSTAGRGQVGGFHGLQHAGDSNNGYATINWWLAQQTAELCTRLDGISEGENSLLDNCVVLFGSGMHGSDHDANALPIVLLGGGGGRLRTDQHIRFEDTPNDRPLRDLYLTLGNEVFGLGLESFGSSVKGAQQRIIGELLG